MKSKILIIDDDPGIRRSLALSLKTEGYAVLEAANGRAGLDQARAESPALIICDVNMPEMDGYAVVKAVRESPALASIPFIFLTARGERAEMRKGMNLGADDYLTKPFTREELVEAVQVRLKKHDESLEAITQQLILDSDRLRSRFVSRLTGQADRFAVDDVPPAAENRVIEATVLFTDIRGFTTISERLSVTEIATVLNQYFQRACEPIIAAGGKVVKFIGDGIMAVFPHGDDLPRERQALHAIQAGLALSLAAHQFRDWMHAQFAQRGLPEFAIGVGIHTGEVTLCQVGAGQDNFTAVGDTVNIASRLEGQTKELGWPVVASGAAISAAGDTVLHGAHRVVHLRGRTKPVLVYQVLGVKSVAAMPARAHDELSQQLQQALEGNAEGAAHAVKAALREALLGLLADKAGPSLSSPFRIKNYAVVGKLVERDGSALYLAERENDGQKVALRVRRLVAGGEVVFQRFLRQATTVAHVAHPNVARVFDHGFADDVAYMVTEYFPRGSIRQAFRLPVPAAQALDILRGIARGLVEVHRVCSLADDLLPENVMVRDDGSIALAELDCGGDVGFPGDGPAPHDARRYRAPERLRGEKGDERSDIYSAGAIFFELVTGHPPLVGEPVEMQPPLDRMLAHPPAARFPTAQALLDALS